MSTRYVWNRYNVEEIHNTQWEQKGDSGVLYLCTGKILPKSAPLYYAKLKLDGLPNIGDQISSFPHQASSGVTIEMETGDYLIFSDSSTAAVFQEGGYCFRINFQEDYESSVRAYYNAALNYWAFDCSFARALGAKLQTIQAKGDLLGPISGPSQGPYPPCPAAPPALW